METENTKQQEGMKMCTKCGRLLPIDSFYKEAKRKDGHQCYCKECTITAQREKRQRDFSVLPPNFNSPTSGGAGNPLSSFTPRQLMNELASRGYKGHLSYTMDIDINNLG